MTSGKYTITEEIRAKMSNSQKIRFQKENIWNKGIPQSEEQKEKQSKTMKRLYTEGILKPNSGCFKKGQDSWKKYHKGIFLGKNNPMYGKHHTDETKRKISIVRSKTIIPKFDTTIEVKIQNFLKNLGIDFLTHFHMKMDHSYRCDIFIPIIKTVIECDGDYFHGNPKYYPEDKLNEMQKKQKIRDELRTRELIKKGFKVIRIWENEIRAMNINEFKERIK